MPDKAFFRSPVFQTIGASISVFILVFGLLAFYGAYVDRKIQNIQVKIDTAIAKPSTRNVTVQLRSGWFFPGKYGCERLREHYVRRFMATSATKGSDCMSQLLVVVKPYQQSSLRQ